MIASNWVPYLVSETLSTLTVEQHVHRSAIAEEISSFYHQRVHNSNHGA